MKRRAAIQGLLAVPAMGLVSWRGAEALPATPACADDHEPTPEQTAGPFFKARSPQRVSLLEPGLPGPRLVLGGRVLTTACAPVPRALLDFWHTDDAGQYDLSGFRCRGHQFADASGRFRLETIVPGAYSGRPRHIHVRVQAPGGPILTTQLYFPGEARNAGDGLFSPRLLMEVTEAGGERRGTFDFVLQGRR
jgi:protocatechuate 3,4-dioxygenase beta subunit